MTFEVTTNSFASKAECYAQLAEQLRSLLAGEQDFIANAANFSALLFHSLVDVSWVGLYLYKEGELVLGPFQGKPACVRIAIGKGVCGTAAQQRDHSGRQRARLSRPHRLRQRLEFRDSGAAD